jgi:NADH-quinone oxidoreductase subunit A
LLLEGATRTPVIDVGILHADTTNLWPLALYFAATIILVAAMIGLSHVLGQRHRDRSTGEPYESGMAPTGPSRVRFHVEYYLIAMFFVIFDVEAVFVYAWAVSVREAGWSGFVEALIFICILLTAILYLWRLGALEWGPSKQREERNRRDAGSS